MNLNLDALQAVGVGLRRPECVVCDDRGNLYASHLGHGVTRIAADGVQHVIGNVSEVDGLPWVPNGLALQPDGTILVANMGQGGGVWRLGRDGDLEPFFCRFEGRPLPATNFVLIDQLDRIWVSVSTRQWPISAGFYPDQTQDGFIVLLDGKTARIVADKLAFANEVRVDRGGHHLYVSETFAGRISRFPIGPNGDLGQKQIYLTLPPHTYPDGIAFDAEDNLWIASIISNRILKVSPDREITVVLEDSDAAYLENVGRKLGGKCLGRDDLASSPATALRNPSSICFAGDDRHTAYIGSLSGSSIISFRADVTGHRIA